MYEDCMKSLTFPSFLGEKFKKRQVNQATKLLKVCQKWGWMEFLH